MSEVPAVRGPRKFPKFWLRGLESVRGSGGARTSRVSEVPAVSEVLESFRDFGFAKTRNCPEIPAVRGPQMFPRFRLRVPRKCPGLLQCGVIDGVPRFRRCPRTSKVSEIPECENVESLRGSGGARTSKVSVGSKHFHFRNRLLVARQRH